jgi:hypothetical protein
MEVHTGKFIFSERPPSPRRSFQKCLLATTAAPNWRMFSYWDQHLAVAYVQLAYGENLRNIEASL